MLHNKVRFLGGSGAKNLELFAGRHFLHRRETLVEREKKQIVRKQIYATSKEGTLEVVLLAH